MKVDDGMVEKMASGKAETEECEQKICVERQSCICCVLQQCDSGASLFSLYVCFCLEHSWWFLAPHAAGV